VERLTIIGVHPVAEAAEPCHLLEIRIDHCSESFDLGDITQELTGQPRTNWQVPYDEHLLDEGGNDGRPCVGEKLVGSSARVAFFFHDLDPRLPLLTPAGPVALPEETPLPTRLRFMRYERP
jgi:hypothetical protein